MKDKEDVPLTDTSDGAKNTVNEGAGAAESRGETRDEGRVDDRQNDSHMLEIISLELAGATER